MDGLEIRNAVNELIERAYENSNRKGFWGHGVYPDDAPSDTKIAERLCLIHSEVSEALELLRDGDMDLCTIAGKPEGFVVEIADVVIRCLDLCGGLGLDLATALQEKMAYNEGRPYKHGKRL